MSVYDYPNSYFSSKFSRNNFEIAIFKYYVNLPTKEITSSLPFLFYIIYARDRQ